MNRKHLVILAVVILGLAFLNACRPGRQCGQFSKDTYSYWGLHHQAGCLTVVDGSPLSSCSVVGPRRPLLHLLLVVPGMRSSRFGISGNNGTYISSFEYSWRSKGYIATIRGKWNRRDDTVTFGSATYDRAKGNTFVVVLERDGGLTSWQLPNAPAQNDEQTILEHIKREMSGNPIVDSAVLATK